MHRSEQGGVTYSGSAAGAGAVGLNGRALLNEGGANGGSLLTINLSLDAVAAEGNSASNLSRVGIGVEEGALSDDLNGAAGAKVVELGSIELNLDSLTSSDSLESFLGQTGGGNLKADAIKVDLVAYHVLSQRKSSPR